MAQKKRVGCWTSIVACGAAVLLCAGGRDDRYCLYRYSDPAIFGALLQNWSMLPTEGRQARSKRALNYSYLKKVISSCLDFVHILVAATIGACEDGVRRVRLRCFRSCRQFESRNCPVKRCVCCTGAYQYARRKLHWSVVLNFSTGSRSGRGLLLVQIGICVNLKIFSLTRRCTMTSLLYYIERAPPSTTTGYRSRLVQQLSIFSARGSAARAVGVRDMNRSAFTRRRVRAAIPYESCVVPKRLVACSLFLFSACFAISTMRT